MDFLVSRDDLRIAYAAAQGYDLAQLDPTTGRRQP